MDTAYSPPLALTAISGVFLALGAACALVVAGDILLRRGWQSMMWIMIPVYIINATYMLPIELFVYFKYGRPSPPQQKEGQISKAGADADTGTASGCHHHASPSAEKKQAPEQSCLPDSAQSSTSPITNQTTNAATNPTHGRPADNSGPQHESCETAAFSENPAGTTAPTAPPGRSDAQACASEPRDDFSASSETEKAELSKPRADDGHGNDYYYNSAAPGHEAAAERAGGDGGGGGGHCHMHGSTRPMYATVLVGVSHCGAGCVLGDLVGEWLVYGTGATINGEMIWPELLIDYAFALLFGIIFQYFSIAPMSGEWGPKSVWRAAKADILSLTSFEIGAFGWMVAFQVGIFGYKLSMATWTYWWMMQIGMVLGFGTAMPVNWWLISQGIKEPCA